MSTMREHLAKVHTTAATFHHAMAKCHGDALGKAVAGDSMHHFHKAAQEAHATAAEAHESMCEECQKATDATDLAKRDPNGLAPLPNGFNRLAPPPGVTAVPRTGSPSLPAGPNVAPEFAKMFSVADEEERSLMR